MAHQKYKGWSIVEIEYLIENYENLSIEKLCEDLLKSKENILAILKDLKIRKENKKGPTPVPREYHICENPYCKTLYLITKYDASRSDTKYCSNECCSKSAKIKVPKKIELIDDYEDGLSTNDIAQKYNISKGTVYNLFKKYGIETRSLSDSLKEFFKSEAGDEARVKRLKTVIEKYGRTAFSGGRTRNKWGIFKKHAGFKEDLGITVRSGWEANFLRYLNFKNIIWEYEPRVFVFNGIKRGTMSYLPDIYLPEQDIWIEIKGQLIDKDKVKMRRFKKYYPEEYSKMQVVVGKFGNQADKFYREELALKVYAYFNDLKKEYKDVIRDWE